MKFQTDRKWLFFLFVTLASLWLGGYIQREIRTFRETAVRDYFDFNVYYTAALVAASDEADKNLYSYREIPDPNDASQKIVVNPQLQSPRDDSTYGRFARRTGSDGQYLYPPFFAIAVEPFTNLPFEQAKIIWHVFIFFLAAAAVFLTVKLLYEDYLTIAIIGLVAVAVMEFTLPMQDLLFGSNVSSLILFLIAAGLCLHKKCPALGALFFVLAVIIKLTPIIVVPLMLMRRQWRWAIAFGCWSVLLVAVGVWQLGWRNHVDFAARVLPAMSSGIPHQDNRSLSTGLYVAATGKFLSYDEIRQGAYIFPEKTPLLLFKLLSAISFGALLFFFWFYDKTGAHLTIEIFVLMLWSLIFSPVSLRYGYLLAAAPIIFAWLHPLTKNASTARLTLLSIGTLAIFSVLPDYAFYLTNSVFVRLALFSIMPAGGVVCMLHLLSLLKNQSEISSPA